MHVLEVIIYTESEDDTATEVVASEQVISNHFSPATTSHVTTLNSQEWGSNLESVSIHSPPYANGNIGHLETLRNRGSSNGNEIENVTNRLSERRDETVPSRMVLSMNEMTDANSLQSPEEWEGLAMRWKSLLWKTCVYLVTIGMLTALLMGLNMSWAAITAALALVVLDFKEARPCLEEVSYSLLIFFCGMFITVEGFKKTGIPSALWDFIEPYARIDHILGLALLAAIILVLSNLVSSVPTVLLLGARVAASAGAILEGMRRKHGSY